MEDEWKAVPETKGKYLVNRQGEVKSLCYTKPRILVSCNGPKGYQLVNVFINGSFNDQWIDNINGYANQHDK